MKKVLIVKAWGRMGLSAEEGGYDLMVGLFTDQICGLKRMSQPHQNLATVQVVDSMEAAEALLGEVDVIIFMTAGMLSEARRIKKVRSSLQVVVLTAVFPEDEVLLVQKDWLVGNEGNVIRSLIMG